MSEDGEPSAKPKQAEQRKSPTVNGRTTEEAAEPEEATCGDELAADMGERTDAFAAVSPTAATHQKPSHDAADSRPSGAGTSEQAQRPTAGSGNEAPSEENAESAGRSSAAVPSETHARTAGQATIGQATSGKRPPRSLPPSRGGSAEALDTQSGGPSQSQLRLGVPPPFLEDPGSVGSQRRFAHMGDLGTALDKHVSN